MSKVLIKFACDWDDDMSIEGFHIIDEDQWNRIDSAAVNWFDKNKGPYESYFNANETFSFLWDSYEEWREYYEVKAITAEDEAVLTVLLGKSLGVCPLPEFSHA